MFGLKEEVIAGVLAVALLVVAAGILYVRHVMDKNTDLEVRVAHAANVIADHERTESALTRDAATKEAANAENIRTRNRLAAELAATQSKWATLKRDNPEYRSWADTPLPPAVRDRRLRAPAAAVQP